MKVGIAFILGILAGTGSLLASLPINSVANNRETTQGNDYVVQYPEHPTRNQSQLLGMAYDIAKRDGHKFPQLLQGIILQESNAGEARSFRVAGQSYGLKPNHRYYGVAQIKLSACRAVLKRYPELKKRFRFDTTTDEEVIARLITDDEFNLAVASKYLLILEGLGYNTLGELATAYNKGPGGAEGVDSEGDDYAIGVITHIEELPNKKNNAADNRTVAYREPR